MKADGYHRNMHGCDRNDAVNEDGQNNRKGCGCQTWQEKGMEVRPVEVIRTEVI